MTDEIKALSACVRAIEKLPHGKPRELVISFLVARYTESGRAQIKLAVEFAEIFGDTQRARDVRKNVLNGLLEMDVGGVEDVDHLDEVDET